MEDTFESGTNNEANYIQMVSDDDLESPAKPTDLPEKPIVVAELLLYDKKGKELEYLVTHNHILINRASAEITKTKLKRP